MHHVRIGLRTINLEYVVSTAQNDGTPATETIPPGVVRLRTERGPEIDLEGDDAEAFLRCMAEVARGPAPGPGSSASSVTPTRPHDPVTGRPLPLPGDPREQRG